MFDKNKYAREWSRQKRETDPAWLEKYKAYRREWARKKYASDPIHRERLRQSKQKYRSKPEARVIERQYSQAYWRAHPARAREHSFKRYCGVTREQADSMSAAQGGLCAICRKAPDGKGNCARLHVDHDHLTGKIRGMLCHRCNRALGFTREDPTVLRAMADYLERR